MIVFALGNPGTRYELTRHNVAELVLLMLHPDIDWKKDSVSDAFAADLGEFILARNAYHYMNESGRTAKGLLKRFEMNHNDLCVVHDELDLPFGVIKVSHARGAGGHNGVNSIIYELKTNEFTRIRVGIGHPAFFSEDGTRKLSVKGASKQFVLSPFSKDEQKELPKIAERVGKILDSLKTHGLPKTMEEFNKRV